MAAFAGKPGLIERLESAGADLHKTTRAGGTALHYALTDEVVHLLLERGLDPQARTVTGLTPENVLSQHIYQSQQAIQQLDQVRHQQDEQFRAFYRDYRNNLHNDNRKRRQALAVLNPENQLAATPEELDASSAGASALVIHDNSGFYMSPWTSDGVLAEWVNMSTDVQIGEAAGGAVGAAVGAEVGRRVLEGLPGGGLLGGMLGNQAGKTAGRSAGIEAAGGMDHVRATSDMSFHSLEDMARYLRENHGNDPNFAAAIDAANRIYPGLKEAM